MKNYRQRGPLMYFLGIVLILLILGGVAYGAYQMGVNQGVGLADGSFDYEGGFFMPHMRGFGRGYMGSYGFGMGFGGFFGLLFMFLLFGFLFRLFSGWGMHPRRYYGPWKGRRPYWDEDEDQVEDTSDKDPKPSKKDK